MNADFHLTVSSVRLKMGEQRIQEGRLNLVWLSIKIPQSRMPETTWPSA